MPFCCTTNLIMSRLKIAVIGAGLIGKKHIELVACNSDCELAAICDENSTVREIARQYNTRFYPNIEHLLAEQNLDGAIIAAPTTLHASLAITCAERGVHLLIEKPIASTLAEAEHIIQSAERYGIRVLVGHHRRHNAMVQKAQAIVSSGELGKLVAVSAMFTLYKPDDYFYVRWRREPGGGPILINLIHDLDNLRFICGEIESVYAAASMRVREFQVEDTAALTLQFENGALGTVLVSDTVPAPWSYEMTTGENPVYPTFPQDCYHFMGTRGSFAFPSMTLWQYPASVTPGWHQPLLQQRIEVRRNDALVSQLEHFCRVIRGEKPIVSAQEGARTLAATLAASESAKCAVPIVISEMR